jgi:RimJ/RimL family protein N-acetyltransferase
LYSIPIDEHVGALLFTCHPEDWGGNLDVLFSPRMPIPMHRRHYTSQSLDFDWRSCLPDGFEVHLLKPDLLTQPGLETPLPLQETLDNWKSIINPQFSDYGFITLQQDNTHGVKVAGWATVDGVCAGSGDLGFEVLPEFRRRGLGTVLAAAAIEHGLHAGIKTIHWTCAETNSASIRTAEKLGLQKHPDYTLYLLVFDEAYELAQRAYLALESGDFQSTVDLYDNYFNIDKNPPAWAYIDYARACAGMGKFDQALHHLALAVNQGWEDLPEALSHQEFKPYHNLSAWQKFVEEMKVKRL